MYNKKYRKNSNDKDIFDDAEKLGNLAIKAYDRGGTSLVLFIIGIICLVVTIFLIFISLSKIWPILFFLVSMLSFIFAIYLHADKKKEICPKCRGQLIEKAGKFGKFFGCSNYPNCKFTKNIYVRT